MEVTGTLRALTEVDYRVEFVIPRASIESRLGAELRVKRHTLNMPGYRAGAVPLPEIRRLFGRKLVGPILDEVALETFQIWRQEQTELDFLGEPRVVERQYDLDAGDFRVAFQFAVRPAFDLAAGPLGPVTKFVKDVATEEVDAEIDRRREETAEFEILPDDQVARGDDTLHIDLQPIDAAGEPRGPKQEGAEILLNDRRLPQDFTQALVGTHAGSRVEVAVPIGEKTERYQVDVLRVLRRHLPALAQADRDRLRQDVRKELETSFQERAQRDLQEKMKERFVDSHTFVVPETLVESALDRFVEKELRAWDGKREFDEDAVRNKNREAAERAARWQVLKARLIREENLEAREEDFEIEYENFAKDSATVESVKLDFARQPGLRRKVAERIVERQVVHALARRFEVVEKNREDVLREYYDRLANRVQM